jgi:ribosomal protein S18 acetylase RimI-like enzyme
MGEAESMSAAIRPRTPEDDAALVALSLDSWEPVFASLQRVLGDAIFLRLHPDWRADQKAAVAEALADEAVLAWVAEVDTTVAGFVAIHLQRSRLIGEIWMIAVDRRFQDAGLGLELTEYAIDRIAEAGMTVARVETGGDDGHAPARRVYEKAGFTLLPAAQYYKAL